MGNILPRFLPVCVWAKFWDRLILPQILVVFKSPTTKIDFVDFLQIQAAFWKTNYTTFSYLLMPIYGQDMSENDARFLQTFALKGQTSSIQTTVDTFASRCLEHSSWMRRSARKWEFVIVQRSLSNMILSLLMTSKLILFRMLRSWV